MWFGDCMVEVSENGTDYTDISGYAASVQVEGGDRATGKAHTFDGDTPIVTAGKRDSLRVTVRTIYTEGTADPFEVVRGRYEGKTALYVRWSPAGGTTGDFRYTTAAGVVTNAPYPAGDVNTADPVAFEFTIETASITKSAVG